MSTNVAKIPLMQKLKETPSTQLANLPEVGEKFKHIYQVMHGAKSGEHFYEAEKFHFMKTLQENQKLQSCSKLSLYGCFMDVAVSGLSFDPSAKQVYIVPFNINIGTRQQPQWESRAQLMISGYGELALRIKQGQIKYADNPVLVYEGDEFSIGTKNGTSYVEHKSIFPRKSDNIIACYLRITRNDGSVDYKVISIEEIEKLRNFSKDRDSKAWTDGLPGMVMSKCIKHAFKTYPKIRKGDFSELSSNTVEQEVEEVKAIDYGISQEEAEFINAETVTANAETVVHKSAGTGFEEEDEF
jgi:phage RecT family recombinase